MPADAPPVPPKKNPPTAGTHGPARQEKLAAALRENLRRRKAQAAARNAKPEPEGE